MIIETNTDKSIPGEIYDKSLIVFLASVSGENCITTPIIIPVNTKKADSDSTF